jgi:hypothetical protein
MDHIITPVMSNCRSSQEFWIISSLDVMHRRHFISAEVLVFLRELDVFLVKFLRRFCFERILVCVLVRQYVTHVRLTFV